MLLVNYIMYMDIVTQTHYTVLFQALTEISAMQFKYFKAHCFRHSSAQQEMKAGIHIYIQSSLSHLVPLDLQYHPDLQEMQVPPLFWEVLSLYKEEEVMQKGQLNALIHFLINIDKENKDMVKHMACTNSALFCQGRSQIVQLVKKTSESQGNTSTALTSTAQKTSKEMIKLCMQTKYIVHTAPQIPSYFGPRVEMACDRDWFLLANKTHFNLGLAHFRQFRASYS